MKINLTYLLMLPVGFTIALISFRVFYSGSLAYIFFLWNLMLAIIPLVVSKFLFVATGKSRSIYFS